MASPPARQPRKSPPASPALSVSSKRSHLAWLGLAWLGLAWLGFNLLICWFVDWLCWFVDLLICWHVFGCGLVLICWFVDLLICWLPLLICWFVDLLDLLICWLALLICWFVEFLICWLGLAWLGSKTWSRGSHMPEDDEDADKKSDDSDNLAAVASRTPAKTGSKNLS